MSEELENKIDRIVKDSIESQMDWEAYYEGSSEEATNEIMSLIKQERVRYGEWLLGDDELRDSSLGLKECHRICDRNDLRAELRQRNKGEIE